MKTESSAGRRRFTIRRMRPGDEPEIVALLALTLGWRADESHRALFDWKHRLNPFGPSPGWVAEDQVGIAGFRTLMRWEFTVGRNTVSGLRAVDTATHPRAQGQGIFRSLTLQAIEEMTSEGASCIFNTPNALSAPGYLSMGWQSVGRLPISFRPSRLSTVSKLRSALTAGDLWSLPTRVGSEASDVLADSAAVSGLLKADALRSDRQRAIGTKRTVAFMQWRYGRCPVGYRALLAGDRPRDGFVLFRVRHRGRAREVVVADTVLPEGCSPGDVRSLHVRLLRNADADYAVALGSSRPATWLPLPGRGPLLAWRSLNWTGSTPSLTDWDLCTGDVELF